MLDNGNAQYIALKILHTNLMTSMFIDNWVITDNTGEIFNIILETYRFSTLPPPKQNS
jgi:hypothetical protein